MADFVSKSKEPAVSEELGNIIYRSMGEEASNNLLIPTKFDAVTRYQYKIRQALVSNKDLLIALHHEEFSDPERLNGDDFLDTVIYSWHRLPQLKDKVRNYITFNVNESATSQGTTMITVSFRVICHEDDNKTDWGIDRATILTMILKEQFDWSNEIGMKMEFISSNGFMTNDGYNYRELNYASVSSNSTQKYQSTRVRRY